MTFLAAFILVLGILFGFTGILFGVMKNSESKRYYNSMCNYYQSYHSLKSAKRETA